MKRKQLWILGGGLVLLIGVSVAATRSADKGAAIQAAKAGRERIVSKVSANGKIQAVTKADISANMVGQVTKLAVKEGDVVKKGQFLMEIDPRSAQASTDAMQASLHAAQSDLESATVNLAQAKADLTRAKANYGAGIIAVADYEKAQTAYQTAVATAETARKRADQAKANLDQARVGLNYTTITAPMDGVVTARRIELGETAVPGIQNAAGTVLLTVSDMSKVEAEMEVDEASIPTVKVGQDAVVHIDAYPDQSFQALVTEVGGSPIIQTNVNEAIKFKVKVQLKNPPYTIKPGLSAQADIFTGEKNDVMAVPIQALVMRDIKLQPGQTFQPGQAREEEGVFLVKDGKARFVPVKTGLMGELDVEIASGLAGGEQVIQGPYRALRELKDGDDVHITKGDKNDKSKPQDGKN